MVYILIFIIGHGSYTGDNIRFQEFNSRKLCEQAGQIAVDLFNKKSTANGYYVCVLK